MPSICCISDCHGTYPKLALPDADILINAGDYSAHSNISETIAYLKWFEAQPHTHKVMVLGNHQLWEEANHYTFLLLMKEHAPSCIYLNDQSAEIAGLRCHGSNVQPEFGGWAFNCERGPDIDRHWRMIPSDTQVLITHGPPAGILDQTMSGQHVGCEDLRRHIDERLDDLRLSVFGHIHPGFGIDRMGSKTFVNAALVNERYELTNAPIVVEIEA